MAAARYWRIIGVSTRGGGALELSALQLYGASGHIASATLSCSIPPLVGTVAGIDGANTAATAGWPAQSVRAGGFGFYWDCGSPVEAIGIRLGSADSEALFLGGATLQYANAGAGWVTADRVPQYVWPGSRSLTVAPGGGDALWDKVEFLIDGTGADGSAVADLSSRGRTLSLNGSAGVSGGSILFAGGYYQADSAPGFALGVGNEPFSVELDAYASSEGLGAMAGYANGSAQDSNYGWSVYRISPGVQMSQTSNTSAVSASGATGTFPLSEWVRVEFSFDGTTYREFLDGVIVRSATPGFASANDPAGAVLQIGKLQGYYAWSGRMRHLRITKGSARNTATYVVTPGPFPVGAGTGQTNESPSVHPCAAPVVCAASASVAAFTAKRGLAIQTARDTEFGGQGAIYGTTKTKGTPNAPTKARVVLLHQRSKLPVRETWSDPVTGAFAFTGIDASQQFLTLAEDAAGNFRPVAASRLVPEVVV